MKKINIIKKNEDYNRMIQSIKPYKYGDFVIFLETTKDETYHFGFSIGKKICNAVHRNKIKRQLKDIIDKKVYKNNFNCIIMIKKNILNKTYAEMERDLFYCLKNLNIIEGDKNE